ncbi:MAG: hypothetical protein R3E32_18190 [Chitinophagales bacterium]
MKKIPLSKKSTIKVYNPSIEFFLARIEAKAYFSYAKQLHGFWDVLLAVMIAYPDLRKIRKDDAYFQKFSTAMSEVLITLSSIQMAHGMYFDVLKLLSKMDEMPDNFFYGVSDLDFYPQDSPPHSIDSYIPNFNTFKLLSINNPLRCRMMRCGDRQLIIQHFLPESYIPFNGIIWRRYGYNGLLEPFFEKVKDNHHITIVGPHYYHNFGELLDIERFHHIAIDQFRASEKREELLQTIVQHQKTLQNEDAIYFFVASSLSLWLISRLHNKLPNSYLIDVGQALDSAIPPEKMKISSEFQLRGYKKEAGFKTYKTANPNYFVEKEQGDRIVVTDEKEVVFLDKKRSLLSCYFVSLQTKFLYFVYHKAKVFRYADNPFIKNAIRLVRYMNYLLKSK